MHLYTIVPQQPTQHTVPAEHNTSSSPKTGIQQGRIHAHLSSACAPVALKHCCSQSRTTSSHSAQPHPSWRPVTHLTFNKSMPTAPHSTARTTAAKHCLHSTARYNQQHHHAGPQTKDKQCSGPQQELGLPALLTGLLLPTAAFCVYLPHLQDNTTRTPRHIQQIVPAACCIATAASINTLLMLSSPNHSSPLRTKQCKDATKRQT